MLSLNLIPIFHARGIDRPFSFLVKAGFSSHTANVLLNSTTRTFRLDHIEKLCTILVCEPNDLLNWTPDRGQDYPKDHPLLKLQSVANTKNIKETLSTIPYKQLKEITSKIVDGNQ